MKKIVLLILTIALFTGCQNEPLDGGFTGIDIPNNPTDPGTPGGPDTGGTDLTLTSYSFDVTSELPFFGPFQSNIDFIMNSNNTVATLDTETIIFGATIIASGSITRNGSGTVTGFKTFEGSTQTAETTINYSGTDISQIVYDDFQDDTEDYTYNFATSGSTVTKTEPGSSISIAYTFNGANRLINKELFDAGTSIQVETLVYDSNGNCTSVTVTGDNAASTTYGFDANTNPLKAAFSDQYYISLFNDDDEAEAGTNIVQFHSTNNWSSITTSEGQVSFMMSYNTSNRITARNGDYDLGDGVTVAQDETFNYVN